MVPPGYNGKLLPKALVYEQRTYNGWLALRPIIKGATPENPAKAAELVKKINIHPLAKADTPRKMKFLDLYGKLLEEELVEEQNLAMMGLLARVGIRKGETYKPDAKVQAIFDKTGPEARQYMLEQYHRFLNPRQYEGEMWSSLSDEPQIWNVPRCQAFFALIGRVLWLNLTPHKKEIFHATTNRFHA